MSQSPNGVAKAPEVLDYATAWRTLGRLIREGQSFAGWERDCAFLNTRGPRFATVSAMTGLDFMDDGRAVAVTDWDNDGDLDVWFENRTGPRLRFARNDLPAAGHHYLSLKLEGTKCNRDAIGARIELYPGSDSKGRLIRTLRAGDGYLAQSSKGVHFGLGADARIDRIVVRWPGQTIEEFRGIEADHRYHLVQGTSRAASIAPRAGTVRLAASSAPLKAPPPSDVARIFLSAPAPAPILKYTGFDGREVTVPERTAPAILVNLWASWCPSCAKELGEFSRRYGELKAKGLRILALNIDGLGEDQGSDLTAARKMAREMALPFDVGVAPYELVDKLRLIQSRLIYAPRPFPIPTSFLIDADGLLAVIYKGPAPVDQILNDLPALRLTGDRRLPMALEFPGIRQTRNMPDLFQSMGAIVQVLADGGYPEEAISYYRRVLRIKPNDVEVRYNLGTTLAGEGLTDEAIEQYREALKIEPDNTAVLSNLGFALAGQGKLDEAIDLYHRALELDPGYVSALTNLGAALASQGKLDDAVVEYRRALESDPGYTPAINNLAVALSRLGKVDEAIPHYRRLLALDPSNVAVHLNLGMALRRQGKIAEATAEFSETMRLKPDQAEAHFYLGLALAGQGKLTETVNELSEAARLKPDMLQVRYFLALALVRLGRVEEASRHFADLMRVPAGSPAAEEKLAWALSTSQDAAFRDGAQAIKLAQKVCEATNNSQAGPLDALAAAYAEAGRFGEAVETARKAVEAALSAGQSDLAAQIKTRLQLYEAGRPFRDAGASN